MKHSKKIAACFLLAAMQHSDIAGAIEVFPIIKEIRENTPRDNYIIVRSSFPAEKSSATDKKTAAQGYEFVTLELFHVTNPGETQEKRVKELGSLDPTLVFSPTRLIIPYGEERKVRIMPLKPVSQEQVYRLRVRPNYPEQSLEEGKVRFAIGYDILLRYLPDEKQTPDITIACQQQQWTLTDTGNVRSELQKLLIDGRAADSLFNVYPGHPRTLKVNKTLTFTLNGKVQTYENCQRKG